MAYWDSKNRKIVYSKPTLLNKWIVVDCGCCNGIKWGSGEPDDCGVCGGCGFLYVHKKSGAIAQYPGGRFTGRYDKEGLQKLITELKEKPNEAFGN